MITKVDAENHFVSMFDPITGFYVRTGVLKDQNGKLIDTGTDPFMTKFPELIDVGIMGSCIHGKKGLCKQAGIGCYQSGRTVHKSNMTLEDFKKIAKEAEGKTFQIALGGRGDPNKHEHFREICQCCRDHGIVPNYTTSGLDLTDEEIQITKEFCGAVAVSWYRHEHTLSAIQRFLDAGVKTNIHYVLNKESLKEAWMQLLVAMVANSEYIPPLKETTLFTVFPEGINAVIFLLHKPVGLGSQEDMITFEQDYLLESFFKEVDKGETPFKVGFDSCTVPAILTYTKNVQPESIDTCEAARWSMYISSDMVALPCSFDQEMKWGYDIKEDTIENAWNSTQFDYFRGNFIYACEGCSKRKACFGGCPIKPEIVLCDDFVERREG